MKKIKSLFIVGLVVGILVALVLYLIPWGSAESEVIKSNLKDTLTSDSSVVINKLDFKQVQGKFSTVINDSVKTSEIMFEVKGPKNAIGKFRDFSIALSKDSLFLLKVSIKASSVFTNNSLRDKSLLESEFFNASVFPEIVFWSDSLVDTPEGLEAVGTLNMLGFAQELKVPFSFNAMGENQDGKRVVILESAFILDRTRFGMKETTGIGNEVAVNFYVELIGED